MRASALLNVLPAFDCTRYNVSADVVAPADALDADTIGWSHRNDNSSYFRRTTASELFEPPADFVDVLASRQTGIVVFPDRARHRPAMLKPPGSPLLLASDGPAHTWTIGARVVTQEVGTAEEWMAKARTAVGEGLPSRSDHERFWDSFWNRSYISVGNDAVASQYALERYVQALQARRHRFPIKFNGMAFTAQRPPHEDDRQWGGLNWWQNLRLPYYNMLASGDHEMVEGLIEGFVATLPVALARTRQYWPNMTMPAAFLPEYTHPLFGTTHPSSYGCNRKTPPAASTRAASASKNETTPPPPPPPAWYSADRWNHYNHQGALDLSLFALDLYEHSQNATRLEAALPLIDAVLGFFAQRWPSNDTATGKMLLWPTQSLETWQCPGYPPPAAGATCPSNDMPTVAGLHKVTERALALVPASVSSAAQRARWETLQARLPALPADASMLRPCEICPSKTSNVENAELYAVHPYRLFGVGRRTNLSLALRAYQHRRFPSDVGWNQCAMDAALMGLAAEAATLVAARAQTPPAKGYRFPIFAPHEQDYEPSSDHFGVMSNALTYMLLQSLDDADGTIVVLPAWPCKWDVAFKLHGPRQTVIQGSLVNGTLVNGDVEVTPASRRRDVRVMKCQ